MKRIICLCAASVIMAGCGTLKIKESMPFTEEEMQLLSQEVQSVGLEFSYDYDISVWSIYNNLGTDLKLNDAKKGDDEKKLSEILSKADPKTVTSLYEKIYGNYYSLIYLRDYYEKKKTWTNVNYIKKTLVPPTEYFIYLSEQSLSKKNPDIKKTLDARRSSINRKAINDTIGRLSVVDGFN